MKISTAPAPITNDISPWRIESRPSDGPTVRSSSIPPDVFSRHRIEDFRAARVELDRHVRTFQPRAGTHPCVGNDVARHQHGGLDEVGFPAAALRGAIKDFVAGRRTVLDRVLH